MMPLKGRKLDGGQKIWATVKRLPRDKGCTLTFLEPARSNVAVGSVKELSPMGFEPPYAAAARLLPTAIHLCPLQTPMPTSALMRWPSKTRSAPCTPQSKSPTPRRVIC